MKTDQATKGKNSRLYKFVHRIYHSMIPSRVRIKLWTYLHRTDQTTKNISGTANFKRAMEIRNGLGGTQPAHPQAQIWMNYALQTNDRGAELVRILGNYTALPGKRHWDIGSAFAGTPIAFAKAGAYAHGIEINPELLSLGWRTLPTTQDCPACSS